MPMTASHTEVMTRAMQVGQEVQDRNETRLVENTITAAAKGAGGVVGLEETLKAVHAGRVKTLVVISKKITTSRLTDVKPADTLPSSKCSTARPAAGLSIRSVTASSWQSSYCVKSGGEVDVVHRHPALVKAGEIGALMVICRQNPRLPGGGFLFTAPEKVCPQDQADMLKGYLDRLRLS